MGSSMCLLISMRLLFFLSIFHYLNSCSSLSTQPVCKDFESSALLQFKQSLEIDVSASSDPFAYPKISSWNSGERNDCCSWDGVLCDRGTGYVISLDLSSSQLYGSFNSSSSLFHLVYLRKLNLADNDFTYSQIPPSIRYLSNLTYLNLSMSSFSGQIPPEIFELSNLVSLDLSFNPLKLQNPGLKSVVENLTSLKLLHLSRVNLSSPVPHILANLSSLKSLGLRDCELYGEFPMEIFKLRNLQFLSVADNENLTGYLPEFHSSSPLQILSLSNTSFYGKLPDSIENLKSLIALDISTCYFYGEFPMEIFKLRNLEILSVRDNENLTGYLPEFHSSNPLRTLRLANTGFSGKLPDSIGNLKSLIELDISTCYFYGEFPMEIFKLRNLQFLSVADNENITGYLPEFHSSNPLQILILAKTGFSGKLPDSIGNLKSLFALDISTCYFYGEFPMEIFKLRSLQFLSVADNENLTGYLPEFHSSNPLRMLILAKTGFYGKLPDSIGNLKSLHELDISSCYFSGLVPTSLGNLTNLTGLSLSQNKFSGQIPFSLANLTQLTILSLADNQLTGQIPPWLANLTQLTDLDLGGNKFHGSIPQSICRLANLKYLSLADNNLSGRVDMDLFLKLKNLTALQLSGIHLSFPVNSTFNASTSKLELLGLNACNLTEFPSFLRSQHELKILHLNNNKIQGQIPNWIFNIGKQTLLSLDLSSNFLTTFESFNRTPPILPWDSLNYLDLSSNKLQGSLPIPPPSIAQYDVSNNKLTGEISPLFCNFSSIVRLDLSHNYLGGMLPKCLSKLSNLVVLNLQNNTFRGILPEIYMEESRLRAIDVSYNQLEGQVPRSLYNCTMLEILLLGNNQFSDIFPSWLGKLPRLRVLSLQSNGFHSAIGKPESSLDFPKLQIIDVSFNNFTGKLPYEHFQSWTTMEIANLIVDKDNAYMGAITKTLSPNYNSFERDVRYSLEMTNKRIKTLYEKIRDDLMAVDLSSNKFDGEISEIIGNLKGLHLLNISNNILTGPIPSSLENLKKLEALDLSQNRLSGEIPPQLLQLTFLAVFNVSNNHLRGPIPRGQQFSTFENDSYLGNTGLCGMPLTKKCKISETLTQPPLNSKQGEGSNFPSKSDWVVIMMGYGSGLIIGFVIGNNLTIRKLERFLKNFGRKQ